MRRDKNLFALFVALVLLSMIFLPSMAAVPAEPHDADAMWIEPSQNAFSTPTTSLGYKFNITVWLNITSDDVFGYQVALLYNRTQLKATRSAFTAGSTSDFMTGHDTQSAGPTIDTSSIGNGSVLAFESCKGDDFVTAPHLGSLIWIEMQVILTPASGETLTSTLDLTTETDKNKNWVQDPNLVNIAIAVSDGFYTFTSEALPPASFTLTITASTGGTTNPVPGAYSYTQGQSVSVQANPDSGYSFDHWQLDGGNVGSANPYAVTMNSNHTLNAVFESSLPPGQNPYDLTGLNGVPDGIVDGLDLVIVAKAFGSYGPDYLYPGSPQHPRWNAIADVNKDNRIDGVDLAIECRHFGQASP